MTTIKHTFFPYICSPNILDFLFKKIDTLDFDKLNIYIYYQYSNCDFFTKLRLADLYNIVSHALMSRTEILIGNRLGERIQDSNTCWKKYPKTLMAMHIIM
jgi:hypothetical protein